MKRSPEKDGCQRRPHRFHVSRLPYLAAGSATGIIHPRKYPVDDPETGHH